MPEHSLLTRCEWLSAVRDLGLRISSRRFTYGAPERSPRSRLLKPLLHFSTARRAA
jgi:hypothetical protein